MKGSFDWRRRDLLLILGSNFLYQQMSAIKLNNIDVVSFSRDTDGYILLNANIPSLLPEDRAMIEENIWHNTGTPKELRCPPSGRELAVEYHNGDYLSVEFFEIDGAEDLHNRYEHARSLPILFPITAVEFNLRIGNTNIDINPKHSSIGRDRMQNCFFSQNQGYAISHSDTKWRFKQNSAKYIDAQHPRNAECLCGSGLRYKHCHGAVD
ncbi:SEC-C domain-containing protein [Inquilinus sp. CA228]|uniref:SEC-C domain-containing protein n=1 Tax=Inquilinus sp. CA228 TaxID=3455609 RepID=UPI003F8D7B7F